MRRLATTGALTLLASFGAIYPLPAYADITQSVADTETTDPATDSGGWTQELGTGLSGTTTEIRFPVDWLVPWTNSYGNTRLGVTVNVCDDSAYTNCGGVYGTAFSLSALNGTTTAILNSDTLGAKFEIPFEPSKYYRIAFTRVGPPDYSPVKFKVFGSSSDTYPRGSTNAGGLADLAFTIKGVDYIGSSSPTGPTASNVLFLPGILTSELYMRNAVAGTDIKVWGPSVNALIPDIALNADGTSKQDIYTGDIISTIYGTPIYGPFISYMDSIAEGGTTTPLIKKWKAYPYDWRFDVIDILNNGTLKKDGSRDYLEQDLLTLASSSPTGKVTIIAHSNGGLLAKALALKLRSEGKEDLIDKIVFVGTPQFGTPKAIGQLLHGDELTKVLGLVMYSGTVRDAAATMPGMYGLLPSPAYFAHVSTPVATFTSSSQSDPYATQFGATGIDSYSKMVAFLEDSSGTHAGSPASDLHIPMKLSSTILNKEEQTHAGLDAWTPPATMQVIALAGWGQMTPAKYLYTTSNGKFHCDQSGLSLHCGTDIDYHHIASLTEDGDDTVVSPSATGDLSQILYFDAAKYYANTKISVVHQNLLNASPIENEVQASLMSEDLASIYLPHSMPTGGNNPLLVISAHSPVNIVATDSMGNRTGYLPIPGTSDIYQVAEEIPESFEETYDDEKYLYVPTGEGYSVHVSGYAAGTTTLEVGSLNDDGTITTTYQFPNIPTTSNTLANFTVDSTGKTSNPEVDVNGDGVVDLVATSTSASSESAEQLLADLRDLVNSLQIPYVLKTLLLFSIQQLGAHLGNPSIARTYIQSLEGLLLRQTNPAILKPRDELMEILTQLAGTL